MTPVGVSNKTYYTINQIWLLKKIINLRYKVRVLFIGSFFKSGAECCFNDYI